MLYATMDSVLVYQITVEILTKVADQSALEAKNVPEIKPVSEINAVILVQAHVDKMLNVMLLTIYQRVHV